MARQTTGRRDMLKIGAAGGLLAALPSRATADPENLVSATVSFGVWMMPLNRFPNASPATGNHHVQVPREVTVKEGAAVNFVIAGLHQVVIYADGTEPTAIDVNNTTVTTGTPANVLLIDDPTNRIYFGPDPSLFPRDRVEVVHFAKAGRYLVICGVRSHFVNDNMYGFVQVIP